MTSKTDQGVRQGTDWLTDDLVEPVAIAICYGGFRTPQTRGPAEYWSGISDHAKASYREDARRLLRLAVDGGRIMPRCAAPAVLRRYKDAARLTSDSRALRQYAALHDALPTIWQEGRENG